MTKVVDKLREHQSATPSKWREKAEYRHANKKWLRCSQRIALMMSEKMEATGITQAILAKRMGCSQQYVSKVLKGYENLSIETICKIENVLDLAILPAEVEMA